jgi:endonuclease I
MKKRILISVAILFSLSIGFAQIPSGYYANAAGKTGDVLRAALRDITTNGSVKLPYTSSSFDVWNAYAVTDVYPAPNNTKVWDMYSDVPGGTPAYIYTIYTGQCGTASAEGDCYAREHSMPNSWWGGLNDPSNPQYTDLHHLFPADQYVNNKKSAHPLGQVSSPTWTSTNGSKIGPCSYPGYTGTVFEPIDGYKGDFARAYLYLATRYMNTIGSWVTNYPGTDAQYVIDPATNNYKTWFINMLIAWNNNDPVDLKEIDRNNAIYYNTPQHNRNPFIDHPEYVCLIWGASCTSAPVIASITAIPAYPTPAQTVTVSANITDSYSITSATCYWGTSLGSMTNSINMSVTTAPGYAIDAAIPAQIAGTIVYYKIVATDIYSVQTTSDAYSYYIRKSEPNNYPTAFAYNPPGSSTVSLTWTDATGAVIPDGYIVKASSVGYSDITNPVDGTPEVNSTLVKNVAAGTGSCTYTALTSNKTYYFKIFPYTNYDSDINYKTDGTIPTTSCTTTFACGTTTCMDEGFDAGLTPPDGWTFTSIGALYTGSGYYGVASPALKMDATNDRVQTATVTYAYELSFHLVTVSNNPGSSLKVEGYNGSGWSLIDNITNWAANASYNFVYNSGTSPALTPGFTQFRFTYTKVAGNIGLDDIRVVCPALCNAPSLQASDFNYTSVTLNDMIVRWTRGNGGSVVVAAKTGNSPVNTKPVDGTAYIGNEVFGQGEQLEPGFYVIYEGPASSVYISGLQPGTSYFVAIFEYNTTEYCYNSPGLTGEATPLAVYCPNVSSAAVTDVTATTANSGGNVYFLGNTPVNARGVCWKAGATPFVSDSKTIDGSGLGTFTSNITGLSGSTTYHIRAYATNTGCTNYGDEYIITTYGEEPSNHVTNFSCGTTGNTTIPLTWTDVGSGNLPLAYLIKGSSVSFADITDPVDGTPVWDGALTKNIAQGIQAWTFTGLTSNTSYYFKIYPYTNSGININYKTTTLVPSTSCTTTACIGGSPVTVFSENMGSPSVTTAISTWESANGFQNVDFTMTSGGATNPGDVRITGASSGYIGASGSGNIYFTSTNNNYGFAIEGINASGYSDLTVQFAYRKESASALPTLAFDYWNGSSYVNVPFTFNELATASTGWYLSPIISLPVAAQIAGLRLRWVKSGTTAVRIDDIKMIGTQVLVPPTAYAVTGGGTYCIGGSGVAIGLSNSEVGVNYQLKIDGVNSGSAVAGTGFALSFGDHTVTGTYTVFAANATTGCSNSMTGNAIIALCNITWIGTTSTDWSDGTNWSTSSVPGLSNDVYIPAVSRQPHITSSFVSPAQCKNLTIYSGATLTIDAGKALTAYGSTTIEGSFIIESDINGTGSFIDNGTITGNVTVKKFLTDRRWWYIGSPLNSSITASSAFGTLSTIPSTGRRLAYYVEANHGAYTYLASGDNLNTIMRGYLYKDNNTAENTTVTFSGSLNTGTKSVPSLTRQTSGGFPGFNLICNPYPSAINLGNNNPPSNNTPGLTMTNLETTFWFYNNGSYKTFNWQSGTGIGTTQYVPAMQSFWVRVADGYTTGVFSIDNRARCHDPQTFYKSKAETNIFRIQVQKDTLNDEAVVTFFADAISDLDPFDSEKMFSENNDDPQLYSMTADNTEVAINGQPEITQGTDCIVPLGFMTNVAGTYSLKATNMSEFDPSISVYLEDTYLNNFQNMNVSNSYTFTSGDVNDADRFKLHFGNILTDISPNEMISTSVYAAYGSIYVKTSSENGCFELFDVLGKKLMQKNTSKGLNKFSLDVIDGVYFVKVISGNNVIIRKIILE